MASTDQSTQLSIVVVSTLPWPALRGCLEHVSPQAQRLGAEFIVVMPDRRGLPDDAYPDVVRVVEPGGSLLHLRARGFAQARGAIIAMTEDHCHPHPTWCEAILRSHADHPSAPVIIGRVENTARGGVGDWATYLLGNGAFMAPLNAGIYQGAISSANASFKRASLPATFPRYGWSGAWHADWLRQRGERVLLDPRPAVDHHLPIGLGSACALFYQVGRCERGLEQSGEQRVHWSRVLEAVRAGLASPLAGVRTGLRVAVRKGRDRAWAVGSIPAVALLAACHNAGALVGLLAGPGDAPHRLY